MKPVTCDVNTCNVNDKNFSAPHEAALEIPAKSPEQYRMKSTGAECMVYIYMYNIYMCMCVMCVGMFVFVCVFVCTVMIVFIIGLNNYQRRHKDFETI